MHGIAKVHITRARPRRGRACGAARPRHLPIFQFSSSPRRAAVATGHGLARRRAPAWIAGMDCGHLLWERESGGPVIVVAEAS
jgi:hypothetical protein